MSEKKQIRFLGMNQKNDRFTHRNNHYVGHRSIDRILYF